VSVLVLLSNLSLGGLAVNLLCFDGLAIGSVDLMPANPPYRHL
jgi:hypothetical protein